MHVCTVDESLSEGDPPIQALACPTRKTSLLEYCGERRGRGRRQGVYGERQHHVNPMYYNI